MSGVPKRDESGDRMEERGKTLYLVVTVRFGNRGK